MANYQSLKAAINAVIKANGNKEITGTVLNEVLLAMVNSLGAGYQFAGVATPSTNPGTPDQKVFYIASQAGTYTNFGGAVVSDGIAIFEWNGTWTTETLDLSMAGQVQSDWTETDTTKKSYIKHKPNIPPSANVDPVPTNGSPNAVASGGVYIALKAITDFLNNGYYFVGIAGTSTEPDSVTQYGIFYIASDGGTYTNFLNGDDEPLTLYQGLNILYKNVEDDGWNYFEVFKFSDFVDTTQQQSLSSQQKAQARTNIAAVSYEQQSLNAGQQVQAQNNMMGKAYAPAQFSGLGKKVLAKNVITVSGVNKNVMTQAFFDATNTAYVIQYDYTLGENITIPAGCTLQFDGGSISGDGSGKNTITGTQTSINAGLCKIFGTNLTLSGTWNITTSYPEWFGARTTNNDTLALQKAIDSFNNVSLSYTYNTNTLNITSYSTIITGIKGVWITQINYLGTSGAVFSVGENVRNFRLSNMRIQPQNFGTQGFSISTNSVGVQFNETKGGEGHVFECLRILGFDYGIKIGSVLWGSRFVDVRIGNCTYDLYVNGISNITNTFDHCYFESPVEYCAYIKELDESIFINCNFGGEKETSKFLYCAACRNVKFTNCNFEVGDTRNALFTFLYCPNLIIEDSLICAITTENKTYGFIIVCETEVQFNRVKIDLKDGQEWGNNVALLSQNQNVNIYMDRCFGFDGHTSIAASSKIYKVNWVV